MFRCCVLMKFVELQCESSKEEWKLLFAFKLGVEVSTRKKISVPTGKSCYKQGDLKPSFLNLFRDFSSCSLSNIIAV